MPRKSPMTAVQREQERERKRRDCRENVAGDDHRYKAKRGDYPQSPLYIVHDPDEEGAFSPDVKFGDGKQIKYMLRDGSFTEGTIVRDRRGYQFRIKFPCYQQFERITNERLCIPG